MLSEGARIPVDGDSAGARADVLGLRLDATSYARATRQVMGWARARESRVVCAANVHMAMEAHDSAALQNAINRSDLVTPDGMPLVWYLRALGHPQERVYGPDLMLHVCEAAARERLPVALFGGTDEVLEALSARLRARSPGLDVAWRGAPPFRPLTAEEDDAACRAIVGSGARILFVGLGCPKQELWMAEHAGRLPVVMLGVGAAFDFHAGKVRQAPRFLQRAGLEWLFRLSQEPRRLARRYLKHNPRFVVLAARELLRKRRAVREH